MKITPILFACAVVTVAANVAMPSGSGSGSGFSGSGSASSGSGFSGSGSRFSGSGSASSGSGFSGSGSGSGFGSGSSMKSEGEALLDDLMSIDLQDDSCKSWCATKPKPANADWCAEKGLPVCSFPNPKMCGWGSCKGCPECQTPAPTPRPPLTECADLPAPTDTPPKDLIPSLNVNWKLQTPCTDLQCSAPMNRWTMLYRGAKGDSGGPSIASVKTGSDLGSFQLKSTCYEAAGRKLRTPAFYTSKDEHDDPMVVLYVPTVGVTTSGSVSPRMELRQEKPTKGWSIAEHHTLSVTSRVMHVPHNSKSVAVMQIFNSGPFVEVFTRICKHEKMVDGTTPCEKGKLYMCIFMTQYLEDEEGEHPNTYAMLDEYEMGTKFDLKVEVNDHNIDFEYTPEGADTITYSAECTLPSCYKQAGTHAGGLHFKAGAYLQKIGVKDGSEYGQPYEMMEAEDDYALVYQYAATIH